MRAIIKLQSLGCCLGYCLGNYEMFLDILISIYSQWRRDSIHGSYALVLFDMTLNNYVQICLVLCYVAITYRLL